MTIKSMTAFARLEAQGEWGAMTWELRSVNHRYLEVGLRVPEEFRAMEPKFRERIGAVLGRGKVEGGLRFKAGPASSVKLNVNEGLVTQILESVQTVERLMHVSSSISPMDILRWPDVAQAQSPDLTEVQQIGLSLLDKTLVEFVAAREREGGRMGDVIAARCDALESEVDQVAKRRPQVVEHQRERLQSRLAEMKVEADPGRLEQEMVVLAQKLDVDEELERLRSHLIETRDVLVREEPIGRRLDFLMQEFNREANTLSSKSSDAETTRAAVEMKVLIEQMREQVQNIE